MVEQFVGFTPDEIRTSESTRAARLKWVIVVDARLASGQIVNAAACVAAATAAGVSGLLGSGGPDADRSQHQGLPWAGCSILAADVDQLRTVRTRAAERDDVYVADMPDAAQQSRVYDEYLERLAAQAGPQIAYAAVSLVGPRKAVDRIVGGLKLLP